MCLLILYLFYGSIGRKVSSLGIFIEIEIKTFCLGARTQDLCSAIELGLDRTGHVDGSGTQSSYDGRAGGRPQQDQQALSWRVGLLGCTRDPGMMACAGRPYEAACLRAAAV